MSDDKKTFTRKPYDIIPREEQRRKQEVMAAEDQAVFDAIDAIGNEESTWPLSKEQTLMDIKERRYGIKTSMPTFPVLEKNSTKTVRDIKYRRINILSGESFTPEEYEDRERFLDGGGQEIFDAITDFKNLVLINPKAFERARDELLDKNDSIFDLLDRNVGVQNE